MINKSMLALITIATSATGIASPASTDRIYTFGSLLLDKARRFRAHRQEKAQMRLAPTECLD